MRATAVVVVIGLTAAWWIGRRTSRPALDPPAVVAQVRQLSQLATVRYTVQKVVGLKEQKHPVGEESILLIVQASVEAGIDLDRIDPKDATVHRNGAVELRLPRARILNVTLDEKETKVWDRRKTWWTPWIAYSLDLEQRARIAGIEAARQAALDGGILRQAERNAEASIRSLLTFAGMKSVVIIPASAT
jgi:hypothetical protein